MGSHQRSDSRTWPVENITRQTQRQRLLQEGQALDKHRPLQHQSNAMEHRSRSRNDEPLESSICREGKSMTTEATSDMLFDSDVMAAIRKYTKEGAMPLAKLRPGSFAAWVSPKTPRDRMQNWRIYYQDLLRQSWDGPGDWESNGIGLLLGSDILCYAVTQLPLKFAKDCRCRLFGSPANRFAGAELLIIGHALWRPQGEVYFNPYTADRRPMHWSEILDIESRTVQKRTRRKS